MKTELVTSLKRRATQIISDLEGKTAPILITQHGRKAAYLVDIKTFEGLHERIRILEGIARGERAIDEGRVFSQAQAKRKMKRWLK